MKRYGLLAALAFAVLACAAVWFGGLNQDEGWYLYAARLVDGGKMPYRDFAYTQGPLLPLVYSKFCFVWERWGLLGARVFTALLGLVGLVFAAGLARLAAPSSRKGLAGVLAFAFLGCNLYHIYYLSIPKTYALASLCLSAGFYLYGIGAVKCKGAFARGAMFFAAGLAMAFAAGARISAGAALGAAGLALLFACRRYSLGFVWFGLGGALGLAAIYAPCVMLPGFHDAIAYHTARGGGGFNALYALGSLSRLVRWYAPVFVFGALAIFRTQSSADVVREGSAADAQDAGEGARRFLANAAGIAFLAVFAVQMLAPFPYEDYQVPVMALAAAWCAAKTAATAQAAPRRIALLALCMVFAGSFGSPLLQDWTTNGYDRFWPLMKKKTELRQLQDAAKLIEAIDPGGKTLFTQDLYLAIETNRSVPHGLEMGPFSILDEDGWKKLVASRPCEIAALSGYTFAIEPPVCNERPIERQLELWGLLKDGYRLVFKEDAFGQHATPLLILQRKHDERPRGASAGEGAQ